MSLIKCPECKHMISEYAEKCIYCGCPMSKIKELNAIRRRIKEEVEALSSKEDDAFFDSLTPNEQKTVLNFYKSLSISYPSYKMFKFKDNIAFECKNKPWFFFENINHRLALTFLKTSRCSRRRDSKIIVGNIRMMFLFADGLIKGMKSDEARKRAKLIYEEEEEEKVSFVSKTPSFIYSLNKEEKIFINEFEKQLSQKFEDIKSESYESMYGFKINSKPYNMCWFFKQNNELLFKYRSNVSQRSEGVIRAVQAKDYMPKQLVEIIESIILETSSDVKRKEMLLPISNMIINAIKGKAIFGDKKNVGIAKDVAEYTSNYIFYKYKDLKKFKNRDEFNKFKNKYNDYIYHGRAFSFKYPTEKDAAFIFKYFIASRLVSIVQSYEKTMNVKIIEDYDLLITSYFEMVNKGNVNIQSPNGVNSNYSFIPSMVFEEEYRQFLTTIKK